MRNCCRAPDTETLAEALRLADLSYRHVGIGIDINHARYKTDLKRLALNQRPVEIERTQCEFASRPLPGPDPEGITAFSSG